MKKTILVLLVLLNLSLTGVQAQLNSNLDFAYETLSQRGEFYFSFSCDEPPIIRELSTKLSIDKVQGTTVFAYANAYEFEQFLTYGFEFEPVNDYYFTPKALTMATTVAQMANWDRYPTHAVYLQMLQNFVTNYPDLCRLETIGYSVNGKEIVCLVISDNVNQDEDEPEFFWTGTMHGDELTGWIMIMRFADYLLQNYGTDAQA
ncbi:MAG TPA: M14 family zinc carboxypeptidase, partial [Bacteroidales bacterium]|nr:M14 family zinc carboxypeptidase [Bacteroidales bacterium]